MEKQNLKEYLLNNDNSYCQRAFEEYIEFCYDLGEKPYFETIDTFLSVVLEWNGIFCFEDSLIDHHLFLLKSKGYSLGDFHVVVYNVDNV